MDGAAVLAGGCAEPVQVDQLVVVVDEDGLPVVAALHDVNGDARQEKAAFTRHPGASCNGWIELSIGEKGICPLFARHRHRQADAGDHGHLAARAWQNRGPYGVQARGRYALLSIWDREGAIVVYDARTLQEVKRIPMTKPFGKYNVYNKITRSAGTSH